jgi:hypothetical protein
MNLSPLKEALTAEDENAVYELTKAHELEIDGDLVALSFEGVTVRLRRTGMGFVRVVAGLTVHSTTEQLAESLMSFGEL